MLYSQLTTEQQIALAENDLLVRRAVLDCRRALASMLAAIVDYDAITQPMYEALDPAEQIPRKTNLAGAVNVPHEQTIAMIEAFRTVTGPWNSAQVTALHAAFVGAANLSGQLGN